MRCAAYERIQILFRDPEVNIDPVEHVYGQIGEYVPRHFDVNVAPVLVISRLGAYLNACGIEWRIGILVRRH